MRIVVLGATGTTGGYAVSEALAAGYEVVAYVRNPRAVQPRAGLTVMDGSVEDVAAMRGAFEGAEAVVYCLGVRTSVRSVFRKTDFQQRTLPKVIAAINAAGVRRFVLLSSFGVGETRAKGAFIPRFVFHTLFGGSLFADKAIAERALSDCRANWTAVYPVSLKNGPVDSAWDLLPLDDVRHVPGNPMLTFATVAKVLVDLISDDSRNRRKLLLTAHGAWK
ncbi:MULTISPECIES: NAD(P)-dependent oxidoreductase [unclassified Brenneria]|uniref:NAD(P)-dependent oxidoreductase n=1 Tax=unclassified Brenneria TaxID=2634434 RepID=UPI001551EF25|nr:NAD(P)-binding oxidoreductase [Brenneria sp. hezel4-2-4]MEE3652026.1 NAD(P)-binding oxidoreductase [Brenneria sp. HEZEL_4_2_4]NPD01986.1 SDR family oxidoreductase [Brenneria sp. hezel4-2-4]